MAFEKRVACSRLWLALVFSLCIFTGVVVAQSRSRARALGISFDGAPGPLNAITDVKGVEVGHSTLISGSGKLKVGTGPVRTGVTAILPRGRDTLEDSVFAGWFALNGNGEMTGTAWIDESGFLEGPVMLTNTHSVGIVRDAVIEWRVKQGGPDATGYWWSLPVVAETWDGDLNDINGFHVKAKHAFAALESARGGMVPEGSVGGGTGMICHEFKGGIGTSSRQVTLEEHTYTVGVLVQCNYGVRDELRIAGVPVGKELTQGKKKGTDSGSIIIVVATDAPLLPHQLKRLAKRAAMGLARNGSYSGNGSGDLFIAFSTANPRAASNPHASVTFLPNDSLDAFFLATVQATEESIINALVASDTMIGIDDVRVEALPIEKVLPILRTHGRLSSARP